MNAYYYDFKKTGVPEIDLILSAIACAAGRQPHHTIQWCDEATPYPGHKGDTPEEWIQNAADKAAATYKANAAANCAAVD